MAAGDEFERAAEALRPGRSASTPRLREAAALFDNRRFGLAAKALREYLKDHPRDVDALHLLAETALRNGRNETAETLLAQCLELAPDFIAARFSHAGVLLVVNKPQAALAEVETLLRREPRNPLFRRLKASALEAVEDYAASAPVWRALTEDLPREPDCWVRYGHALRSLGRREECISAYRKAVAIEPSCGSAWWALADLKTFLFEKDEIGRMEMQLVRAGLTPQDRTRLLFALGKAYADLKLYEKSFRHYADANALQRQGVQHDPEVLTAYVARCEEVFTAEFFRARAGSGCLSADPIFIVGMPRSGSTLVEQILASHSQIEGTRELSDLASLARHIHSDLTSKLGAAYPDVLGKLDAQTLMQLGERYIESTRAHRNLGRPFFTDKMGPNFVFIGLLQLILPNARIVDVRRHPLACGLSNFMQLFPKGQNDAYRLEDIGRLYRDYVALTAHFDRVLPGKVHRVFYENLVAEPEAEIRRLLGYLGLPFEPACLKFHETERVVATVSSEQVRSPLYRDALEQWRNYEPWLEPLIESLGPVLASYPSAPGAPR